MVRRASRSLLFGLTATATVGACVSYDFAEVPASSVTEEEVVVGAAEPTPADILFVVDNSGSMADEQENLAANFDAFIREIAGQGDYQIGIVSTDVSQFSLPECGPNDSQDCDQREWGGLSISNFSDQAPYYSLDLTMGTDRSACVRTGIEHGCLRGADQNTRIIRSSMDTQQQIDAFRNNVRVGSCGSGQEQGLASMMLALSSQRSDACNQGFLRPEANLVIIIVSDENEDDQPPNGNTQSVESIVSALTALKAAARTRVAVIIGADGNGQASRCRIGDDGGPAGCGNLCSSPPPSSSGQACSPGGQNNCPAGELCQGGRCTNPSASFWDYCYWCSYFNSPDCCSALSGDRYAEFARQMEVQIANAVPGITPSGCRAPQGQRAACLIDSICQDSFAATLSRIAKDLVISDTYNLDPCAAYPPGVTVTIDEGKPTETKLTNGTDFIVSSPDGCTLTFQGRVPQEGEDVKINYVINE